MNPHPVIQLGPVILPNGGQPNIANGARRNLTACDNYRSILAFTDCLYMSNIDERLHIATMIHAFESMRYDFSHDVDERMTASKTSFSSEPRWVDHAFWVARHFFTLDRFPDFDTRMDLVRSFFIVSMRLFWVDGGISHRLASTPSFNSFTGDITSSGRHGASRQTYAGLSHLPTSMPPSTTFCIGAPAVFWPPGVRIQDLWEHDICALFVLVPELVTAVVMRPGQNETGHQFRQLLYKNTYWPAVRVGNDVCVLIDECVRKICSTQLLSYDQALFEVKTLLTPYWPVVAIKRRAAGASKFPFAFNRCLRTDGGGFWLTPFVKWNDTTTRTVVPSTLRKALAGQSADEKTRIAEAHDPGQLATMYPHLYMSSSRRVISLARHSNSIHVDAIGEAMRHKMISVANILRAISTQT